MNAKSLAKWFGRTLGFVTCCFFFSFMIGEGVDGLYKNADPKLYWFLLVMSLSMVGTILAWFNAGFGGGVAILGGIALLAFHLFRGDVLTALVYGAPFVLSGFMFLVSIEDKSQPRHGK